MRSFKRKKECFLVYLLFTAIFKPYFLPTVVQQAYKFVAVMFIFIFLCSKFKLGILKNESVFFGTAVIISSYFGHKNGYIDILFFWDSIYFAICFDCIFMLMKYLAVKGKSTDLLIALLDISGLYAFLSIMTMFTPLYTDSSGLKTYLFGNKFFSSYYILMYISIYYALHGEKIKKNAVWKMHYCVYILISVVFAIVTKCSTSVVASFLLLLLLYLPVKLRENLMKTWVVGLAIGISGLFPVMMTSVMNLKIVQFIVVNVLHESINLNYRNIIYNNHVFKLINGSPVWGYGYGNTAMLERTGYSFSNAQNALMDIVIDYGIVSAVIFVLFILYCFEKSPGTGRSEGILFLIYLFIIIGTIEISYEWIFLWALCLYRWIDYDIISAKNR